MALADKDIFEALFDRFRDQPVEFIMEQYEKAKRLNCEIEKRLSTVMQDGCCAQDQESAAPAAKADESEVARKKITRRMLVVKPQDAITPDSILCCICGAQRQSITQKHLAAHGISAEEYKKLCGYAPDQPLMSEKHLAKFKKIIAKAQKARMEKKRAAGQ